MKSFKIILFVILSVLSLTSGDEIEDFEYEEPESQSVSGKIGNATLSEHIPYMASLRLKAIDNPYGNGHICGAVFVTRQHLLTAAVCVVRIDKDYKPEELVVVAGVRNRYDNSGAHKFDVAKILPHYNYQRFPVMGMDGNLAIITLSEPVPDVLDNISTIEYTMSPVGVGASCTFYGWGKPKSMDGSKMLLKGDVQVVDRELCATDYIRHFCAMPSHVGGCPGDDGGATVCDGKLYGLVGWRYDDYCSDYFKAHLFVEISSYHEFIKAFTNGSSNLVVSSGLLATLIILIQVARMKINVDLS